MRSTIASSSTSFRIIVHPCWHPRGTCRGRSCANIGSGRLRRGMHYLYDAAASMVPLQLPVSDLHIFAVEHGCAPHPEDAGAKLVLGGGVIEEWSDRGV